MNDDSARSPITPRAIRSALSALIVLWAFASCGKKGPPLPPLVRVPAPPADFTAERRGDDVAVQFTVPAANTDGTRPANVERVDVYRFTGPSIANDDQLLKLGTKVASFPVKTPRNPEVTTEPDEQAEEPDLKEDGLDQGSTTQLEDTLDADALQPVDLSSATGNARPKRKTAADDKGFQPLMGPPSIVPSAVYVAVGINPKGRRGPLTRRVPIPLVPPPEPPAAPQFTWDETTIRVTWPRSTSAEAHGSDGGDLLPRRVIGVPVTTLRYHVYDVSPAASGAQASAATPAVVGQLRLTGTPVADTQFEDTRIAWDTTRCYAVRTVATIGGLSLESDASPPTCKTLTDTFPPAAPRDLRAVSTEGTISLIWEPGREKDLAGYIVLRGLFGNEALERITPEPIKPSNFDDKAPTGTHFVYAVQAIDTTGNVSLMSNRADEMAR